jgi:hypothetical protein
MIYSRNKLMRILTVDGPEKAGKNTLIQAILDRLNSNRPGFAVWRHWNRPVPRHMAHMTALLDDMQQVRSQEAESGQPGLLIWNRSHLSEAVYGSLLGRKSDIDMLQAELWYGRILQTLGPRIVLLGPDEATLATRRDQTDLPVDPAHERAAFLKLGATYGYQTFSNPADPRWIDEMAEYTANRLLHWRQFDPAVYLGPSEPEAVFVTSKEHKFPFATKGGINLLAEKVGANFWKYGYATVHADRGFLRVAPKLIYTDKGGSTFCKYYLDRPDAISIND